MKNERIALVFKTSLTGIIANVLLAGFKAFIGVITNSIAITLDAVNNLTDAISSIITIVGIYLSGKDPDKKHPFGYGRIEYISTLAIAALIVYAGVTAGVESVKSIFNPETPDYNVIMLIILVVAIFVKIFLGILFTRKGKESNSDSLLASGKDALFDALISTATVIAAVVFMALGIALEAYLGVVISLVIIKAGMELLGETVSKILGEGASAELVIAVKKTIVEHEGIRGAYDLIFNNYGNDVYVASVHIEVPDTMSANEIDKLTRHIMKDVHEKHNVLLTAIGVYSYNTSDSELSHIRENVRDIVMAHEYVKGMHGFYVEPEANMMRFDIVISFDAKSRNEVHDKVVEAVKVKYPEYDINAGMDVDFNEVES